MLKGSMVAIVTPFRDGKVDEAAYKKLIDFQIENGTQVIVPCGTTGESATLSVAEHHHVIELAVQLVAGRVPVMAGTGSNNTAEAVELTKAAKAAGASVSLQIVPYYNKPTQDGVYRHFMSIADAADFPLVLYNIQGRTGINVLPETIAKLSQACPLLVGVKEASGNLEQISRLHFLLDEKVSILSGDDALTLPIMAVGGKGVISVIANIAPKQTSTFVELCHAGKFSEALPLHEKMLPMIKALFLESNPTPVKAAMEILGLCSSEVRLPLVAVSESTREKIKSALSVFGLIA
ncbi:4-hydroxy-tetrahydrodipicolinate synthase [bacterium]|nr:4-hydroxy-tetrahydrodipicolinate synthase [bacterium]